MTIIIYDIQYTHITLTKVYKNKSNNLRLTVDANTIRWNGPTKQ